MTHAQDLIGHGMLGTGSVNPWLEILALLVGGVIFLAVAAWMHKRSRRLGY